MNTRPLLVDQFGNPLPVDITGITDGDVLTYDAGTGLWIPAAAGGSSHAEDHDHDGTPTQKLVQANTHESPDTDSGTGALHHTLGTGANQAAAGTHSHVGGGGGGGTWDATVTKTTDEDVESSTTLQNDDELFFATTSGKTYLFECVLIYASPEGGGITADIKIAFGEDTSTRGAWKSLGLGTNLAFGEQNATTSTAATGAHGTGASKLAVVVRGIHHANGGTFRLLWAQNTSSSENTRVYAGSILRYEQID